MSHRRKRDNRILLIIRALVVALLLMGIFMVTLTTAAFLLLGSEFSLENVAFSQEITPSPNPTPTVEPEPLVTPIAASMTTFRSVALGLAIDYPADWQKEEQALRVIFSPSAAGLDVDKLQDAALWVGIPADESFEPGHLLADILAEFPAEAQRTDVSSSNIAGQSWLSTQLSFADGQAGQPAVARIVVTNRNDVGYFMVAVAPAQRWPSVEPVFQGMMSSFRFTEEVVIRPTDATPPPTPTPTPTPQIYVVQSGDTLSEIAVRFGVTVEAIANRNGLERPEYLRTGQKLIIPTQRR